MITEIRRLLAAGLALLVAVTTFGRVRVNWTGTSTAQDGTGDGRATVTRDRDAR